jgi:hypothetical protein
MSALPSFDPPEHFPHRRKSRGLRQPRISATTSPKNVSSRRKRAKLNPVYAHRRQGLEVFTKLVTYSTLSIFGIITIVNLVRYNYSLHGKLSYLETQLQDTKLRNDKINSNFSRSFDPRSQISVMQENTHKIPPDRLQVVITNPNTPRTQKMPLQK